MSYVQSLVNTMGFKSKHAGLEENLGSTETRERDQSYPYEGFRNHLPFVANGKNLSIREFVAGLDGRRIRSGI